MAEEAIITQAGEARHYATKTTAYVGGKHGAIVAREASEGAMQLAGFSSGLAHIYAMGIMMGLGAAVSAGVTQMEYLHQREKLRKNYGEELAAKRGKSLEKLSDADLEGEAGSNRVIDEELRKQKRQRNWGIAFSVAATLVSLLVVTQLFTMPALPLTGFAMHAAEFAIGGAVGLLSYNVVKQPLHWLGDKLFGLDEKTTHDRIMSLKRDREHGKEITREQVLSVFAAARPEIDAMIAADYGKRFNELALPDRQAAAEDMARLLPLDQLRSEINRGEKNVTELAFAVEGQVSGVRHAPQPMPQKKPGTIRALVMKMQHAMHRRPHVIEALETAAAPVAHNAMAVVQYVEHSPAGSFVQRLGLAPKDREGGMVQQLGLRAPSASALERVESRALSEAAEMTGPH